MLPILRGLTTVPVLLGLVAGAWWAQQWTTLPTALQCVGGIGLGMALLGLARWLGTRTGRARTAVGQPAWANRIVKASPLVALLGMVLLGLSWASLRADWALRDRIPERLEGIDLRVEGHIRGLAVSTPTGQRFGFVVERCLTPTEPHCPLGLLSLSWGQGFAHPFSTGDGFLQSAAPLSSRRATSSAERPVLIAGDRWQFTVRLKRPRALDNPGTFDAELRMLQDGFIATGYVRPSGAAPAAQRLSDTRSSLAIAFERGRHQIRAALREALGDTHPEAAGVLIALAVGDQAAVGNRWWEVFNRTGVGHLMSISGLHITMLAGLAMALTRRLLRLPLPWTARVLVHLPAPFLSWATGVVIAFVYTGLAGWGIPAQRTCWMLAATACAVLSGRSRGIGAALGLAAAVVTVMDPWAPMAAGFWLSFVAVAAIARHGSAVEAARPRPPDTAGDREGGVPSTARPQRLAALRARLDRLSRRWPGALRAGVASQWAATLSLLPLGALFFSSYSLVSPLANAVAIPLVSGLITPLVLLLSILALIVPGVAAWGASPLVEATALLMRALDTLGGLPFASWTLARPDPVSLILSGWAVAMLLRPHPLPARPLWAFALIPLLVGGVAPVADQGLRVHALDVGQGMAVLVETRGHRVLYDAGPFWSAESNAGQRIVVPWLRARGIRRIDLLVISHPDLDHVGGVHDLLRQIEVGAVLSAVPPGHPFRIEHPNHQPCRRGHQWHIKGARFDILHPGPEMPPGAARSPTNARSCVLRVSTPSGAVLLPGDLEARQERDLIDRLGAAALAAEILVVPHHGSNTSSTDAWIAAVSPRWALVQAGYRNRFGHPTAKVLARYEQAGVKVLRTDRDGAIAIELRSNESPQILRSRLDQPPYWRLP